MKREDLFLAIGMVEESRLARCEHRGKPVLAAQMEEPDMNYDGKYCKQSKKRRMPRTWLIAAIIGAMVFLMGCGWIALRMRDMKLGEETLWYDVFSDEGFAGREPVETEVLTFAGVKGSAGYQAAKEWFEFQKTYDPESKIYLSVYKNLPDFPEAYSSYNLYTQEMKDALDGILQKYSLKPVGSLLKFKSVENVCAALEIEKFTMDGNGVQTNITGGYPFEKQILGSKA